MGFTRIPDNDIIEETFTSSENGLFPERIRLDYKFRIGTVVYQIRVEQEPPRAGESKEARSYAGLYRMAADGKFQPISTRKPWADYGIWAPSTEYDRFIYEDIVDELVDIAYRFENAD